VRSIFRGAAIVCAGLVLGSLAGCNGPGPSTAQESGPELQVFVDRYRFRGQDYASERTLHIAILASGTPPATVNVRDCVDQARIVALIGLLREHGRQDVRFLFPPTC
jgi:hypothetical protein